MTMTQDQELLYNVLAGMLLYNVTGLYQWKGNEPYERELTGSLLDELASSWNGTNDSSFIPYLRTKDSLTEQELEEYHELCEFNDWDDSYLDSFGSILWLFKHNIDDWGLIDKGLALVKE